MQVFDYKPQEQDYRIWLVVNPSVWLMPILMAVLVVALAVHYYAFSLPGQGWSGPEQSVAPVLETVAAPVESAPAAEPAPVVEEMPAVSEPEAAGSAPAEVAPAAEPSAAEPSAAEPSAVEMPAEPPVEVVPPPAAPEAAPQDGAPVEPLVMPETA